MMMISTLGINIIEMRNTVEEELKSKKMTSTQWIRLLIRIYKG